MRICTDLKLPVLTLTQFFICVKTSGIGPLMKVITPTFSSISVLTSVLSPLQWDFEYNKNIQQTVSGLSYTHSYRGQVKFKLLSKVFFKL